MNIKRIDITPDHGSGNEEKTVSLIHRGPKYCHADLLDQHGKMIDAVDTLQFAAADDDTKIFEVATTVAGWIYGINKNGAPNCTNSMIHHVWHQLQILTSH